MRLTASLVCLLLAGFFVGVAWQPISTALASGIVPPAYQVVQNGGVPVTQRIKLNFVNGGCADNAGTGVTDCTFLGGAGSVTSLTGGCGVDANPTPITVTGVFSRKPTVVTEAGASKAFANSDCGKQYNFTNSGAVAISIAQAGGGGNFLTDWFVDYICTGAGGCVLTPATSTVNGAATLTLTTNQSARLWSNGSQYFANLGKGSAAGNTISIGAIASLPGSASTAGDTYYTTDGLYTFVWTGAAWQAFFGSQAVTQPVPGNFSWVNQGGATLSTTGGGLTIQTAGQASANIRAQVAATPAAPWTATFLVSLLNVAGNLRAGVCFYEAGTGKFLTFASGGGGTSNANLTVTRWTNATTFSAQPATFDPTIAVFSNGLWVRLANDNTNITASLSPDGFNWVQYYSEAKAAFFTTAPDNVGIFLNPETTAAPNSHMISLIHFTF